MLRLFRVTHLYLGVFIAPALLFFAFTGFVQTAGLHEAQRGSTYKPPHWLEVLGQLHKKQTTTLPVRGPRPDVAKGAAATGDHAKHDGANGAPGTSPTAGAITPSVKLGNAPDAPPAPQKNHYPMKLFFLVVSVGLFVSTLTGIYMAYKYQRNNALVTVLLVLGVVVPLVALKF